jgi:hypothetical protein
MYHSQKETQRFRMYLREKETHFWKMYQTKEGNPWPNNVSL